jgi:hypothetical protein
VYNPDKEMSGIGAESRPAGLRDTNGGFQQKRTSTVPDLNDQIWSGTATEAGQAKPPTKPRFDGSKWLPGTRPSFIEQM